MLLGHHLDVDLENMFWVRCALQHCRAVWLLVGGFVDPDLFDEVHVALPDAVDGA
jgi:hypothetical protein